MKKYIILAILAIAVAVLFVLVDRRSNFLARDLDGAKSEGGGRFRASFRDGGNKKSVLEERREIVSLLLQSKDFGEVSRILNDSKKKGDFHFKEIVVAALNELERDDRIFRLIINYINRFEERDFWVHVLPLMENERSAIFVASEMSGWKGDEKLVSTLSDIHWGMRDGAAKDIVGARLLIAICHFKGFEESIEMAKSFDSKRSKERFLERLAARVASMNSVTEEDAERIQECRQLVLDFADSLGEYWVWKAEVTMNDKSGQKGVEKLKEAMSRMRQGID